MAHIGYQGRKCLIWPMFRDDKGYGMVAYDGRLWRASNLMCRMAHGEPPSKKHQAAHSCHRGHKGCYHPGHVDWKTPKQNTEDAVKNGRYGSNPAGQKGVLSHQKADEIRKLAETMTNKQLGKKYGVHAETIAKIRRGETWKRAA